MIVNMFIVLYYKVFIYVVIILICLLRSRSLVFASLSTTTVLPGDPQGYFPLQLLLESSPRRLTFHLPALESSPINLSFSAVYQGNKGKIHSSIICDFVECNESSDQDSFFQELPCQCRK